MKLTSLLPPAAAVALMTAAVLAATTGVQATQDPPQAAAATNQDGAPPPDMTPGDMRKHDYPAPTNLKVLPKNLTGGEVREIMKTWAGSLGVHCDFCHAADPNKIGPNGKPQLNFADDSSYDKKIARIMYTMTQQINADYISKNVRARSGLDGHEGGVRDVPSRARDAGGVRDSARGSARRARRGATCGSCAAGVELIRLERAKEAGAARRRGRTEPAPAA